jgi:thiol:disulfide interchange protein DsbD
VQPSPDSTESPGKTIGAEVTARATPVPDMAAGSGRASTLAGYVSLAMLMGALSLLTPCVFPMVPITVSYFTRRARSTRRDSILQALLYGMGIVLTFTGLGLTIALGFGASGLNRFAADPWLNLLITVLFIAFALSLFGIFEIALPARLLSVASRTDEGHGRHFGTLLMGLAFTLTSFTCTAPFLGALFVVASQGDWHWPLAGMLGFSMVFATPFVILALVPRLLWALPRSGVWLVAVKAAMGLLELAAAMKFLSNADLVWGWGIFTRSVVLTSWMLIGGLLLLYFSGVVRLGLPAKLGRPGVARWALMAAVAILVVWLGTGLGGRRLGELEAFLPPADGHALSKGELAWLMNDYDAALAEAGRQERPILVDFTGYTCTNCRWMEANMFPRPEVERELARYIRLRLYTDGRGEMYRRFQQMQRDTFGTVALPYYAVLTPAGKPVVAFGGLTRDPNEYLLFLRKGLE